MDSEEFRKHVVDKTGRLDLGQREAQIIAERDDLVKLVGRDAGLVEAERRLQQEESAFEAALRAGHEKREARLEYLDTLSKAEIKAARLNDLHLAELEQRFYASLKSFYEALNQPLPDDARPPLPKKREETIDLNTLRRSIHDRYITSQTVLVKQLRRPLSGYRARKLVWTTLPVLEALAVSLFIFCIGAGLLGELVPGLYLKIAFAASVWVAERALFERFAGPWFHRKRCRSLEEAIIRFHDRKGWALYLETYVDHNLDDEIKQHEKRLSDDASVDAPSRPAKAPAPGAP